MSQPSTKPRTPSLLADWKTHVALLLLLVMPLLGVGVVAYVLGTGETRRLVADSNVKAGSMTSELVRRELKHWINLLQSFAGLPKFSESFNDRDEETARARLKLIFEGDSGSSRVFVTDPKGVLWSDYPKAPEVLGRDFSERDWFKGVTKGWQPYISRIYVRSAEPRIPVIAVAVPVFNLATRDVIGILVCQLDLPRLTELLRNAEIGHGAAVFLLDHGGTIAAHSAVAAGSTENRAYVEAPVFTAAGDASRALEYTDPISSQLVLATAIPLEITGNRWTVVSQQTTEEAYRPIRNIAVQITGSGLILGLIAATAFFALARVHNGMRSLNQRLAGLTQDLGRQAEERRAAAEALKVSNDELERRVQERTKELRVKEEQLQQSQKMEAIGRLAGGVAHDFNNLLTVILGYAELVLELMPADAPHRGEIEQMRDAGARAAALTRQLLAFSRKQVMQLQLVDLNDSVAHMEKMLRRLIGEDIDLVCKRATGLPPVMFDPGQLEQVIMNLVVNARDAMPKGGKLTIETAAVMLDEEYCRQHTEARPGQHVMLAITDTGTGMTPEVRSKIFEPFFTTKERGQGTGLGLATVYGIVKQGGGNIWVYSEPGQGTTFKIYLPATKRTAPIEKAAPVTIQSKGTETILVVDDEPGVRGLVENVLRGAGYTVLAGGKPKAAIELLREHRGEVSLLLTDVVMPEISGPDLAKKMGEIRPGLKVLFMSGYTDNAIVHHGLLEPDMSFIEKPLRPTALLAKVRDILSVPPQPVTGATTVPPAN